MKPRSPSTRLEAGWAASKIDGAESVIDRIGDDGFGRHGPSEWRGGDPTRPEKMMKPVVLLVGRLPSVIENVAVQLEDLPIEWLAAHDRAEVVQQLEAEPNIRSVVVGAGLDDTIRGDLVGVIASRRPDLCIHFKDRSSGPQGLTPFVRRVVAIEVLADTSG